MTRPGMALRLVERSRHATAQGRPHRRHRNAVRHAPGGVGRGTPQLGSETGTPHLITPIVLWRREAAPHATDVTRELRNFLLRCASSPSMACWTGVPPLGNGKREGTLAARPPLAAIVRPRRGALTAGLS